MEDTETQVAEEATEQSTDQSDVFEQIKELHASSLFDDGEVMETGDNEEKTDQEVVEPEKSEEAEDAKESKTEDDSESTNQTEEDTDKSESNEDAEDESVEPEEEEDLTQLSIDELRKRTIRAEKDQGRLNRNRREFEERKRRDLDAVEVQKQQIKAQKEQFYKDVALHAQIKQQQAQENAQFQDPKVWTDAAKAEEEKGNLEMARIYQDRAREIESKPTDANGYQYNDVELRAIEYQRSMDFGNTLNVLSSEIPELQDVNSEMTKIAADELRKVPLQQRNGNALRAAVDNAKAILDSKKLPETLDQIAALKKENERLKRSSSISPTPRNVSKSVAQTSKHEVYAAHKRSLMEGGHLD